MDLDQNVTVGKNPAKRAEGGLQGSSDRVWRWMLGFFVLVITLWVVITKLALIFEVLGILFGALLLALGLDPLVKRMGRIRLPRSLSVILLYLVLLGFLLGVSSLLLPLFNAELSTLQSQGPALWKSISSTLTSAPLIGQLIPSTSDASGVISQRFDTLLQGIVAAVGSVGSAGLDVGVVFLLAYFMVVSRDELLAEIQRWIPPSRQAHLQGVGVRVLNGLGDWVRAQPLVMLYFAVGFSVSLSLLHVPFALAIGLVGGLLSVVPFFGAIIAALLGVLSALTVKPVLAIWVLGIITMWTELEVHLIAPALYGRAFRIHPAIVLLVMFVGTKVGGLVGLLFSVPIAVVGMIFLDEIRTPAVALSAEDRTSSGTR